MGNYHFIVNALAGSGRGGKAFAKAEESLKARGMGYEVAITEYPRHAMELTQQAIAAGADCIVAVGGDGTVNEVASAVNQARREGALVTMGIFPFGTGNDLARALEIPIDPEGAVEVLLSGNIRAIDGGEVNGRFFINVAGFGFDVDVLERTNNLKQRHSGMTSYLLGIFQALTHLRSLHLTISGGKDVDGLELPFETDALLVCAGAGKYFGGGMKALPFADPFSGLFDVCLIKKVGVLRFLTLLPGFIKGKHTKLKIVRYFRANELMIESDVECKVQLDGEICLNTPAHFRVVKGAIEMIMP